MTEKFYIGVVDDNPRMIECEKWVELDVIKKLIFGQNEEGFIEIVFNRYPDRNICIVCDDTGALTNKPVRFVTPVSDFIHGNCIICGMDTTDDLDRDICGIFLQQMLLPINASLYMDKNHNPIFGDALWEIMTTSI
ncbi:MAG: DUF3846 domain-containing protein [Rivularia sp. (in: cyanobacteria)]